MSEKTKIYYAVANGNPSGIFTNWADAKKATWRCSGVIYKKFTKLEEANSFLNQYSKEKVSDNLDHILSKTKCAIFTDGSHSQKENTAGWRAVVVEFGQKKT